MIKAKAIVGHGVQFLFEIGEYAAGTKRSIEVDGGGSASLKLSSLNGGTTKISFVCKCH